MNRMDEKLRNFKCRMCGNCCRPRGEVRLSQADVDRLAAFLSLNAKDFADAYTELTGDRRGLTLKERESGECVFLSRDNLCMVHDAKPEQCRSFPVGWRYPGFEIDCRAMNPDCAFEE